jgi:hypothetical protein
VAENVIVRLFMREGLAAACRWGVSAILSTLFGRIKQEWAVMVLSRIARNVDSVRHFLQFVVKTN